MSHRPILVSLIPAALIVGLWTAHAQPRKDSSPGPAALEKLSWLAGTWLEKSDDGATEEHWYKPSGNVILGMCRLANKGRPDTYELLLIEEKEGWLDYYLRHFGPGLATREKDAIAFDVRIEGDNQVTFESRDAQRPTRLTYRLTAPDSLHAVLDRQRDGKKLHDEFHMKRKK